MKIVDELYLELNALESEIDTSTLRQGIDKLAEIARKAEQMRQLQHRYYSGEKSVLVQCKQAERELDNALHKLDQGRINF